jgi:hypothetical protein
VTGKRGGGHVTRFLYILLRASLSFLHEYISILFYRVLVLLILGSHKWSLFPVTIILKIKPFNISKLKS